MTARCDVKQSFSQSIETFCVAFKKKSAKNKLAPAEELMWPADVITGVSNGSICDKRRHKNGG